MTLGVTPKGVIFGFRIRIVIVGFEPKNVPFTVCIYIIKKKKNCDHFVHTKGCSRKV